MFLAFHNFFFTNTAFHKKSSLTKENIFEEKYLMIRFWKVTWWYNKWFYFWKYFRYKIQLITLDEDWAAHNSVVGDNYALCTNETSPLCGWKMQCPEFDWFESKYIGVFKNIALIIGNTEIKNAKIIWIFSWSSKSYFVLELKNNVHRLHPF